MPTDYAADDYAAIAAKMRKLQDDPKNEHCDTCGDHGFVLAAFQASGAPNFETCPECGNPYGLQCP